MQEYVCDAYGNFTHLPVPAWSADEILTRQSFEHLSITEAKKAISGFDEILKPNGILRIDVPDHEATVKLLHDTKDPFWERHLFGPKRGDYGYHMMSYTRECLIKLVEEFGFKYQHEEPNIHFYPAFCLRFIKSTLPAPRDYAQPPYAIPDDWRVLEIGPGHFPLPRADVYADISRAHLDAIQLRPNQQAVEVDLMKGLPFKDKEFDYVFCSHVLEHVDNPIQCVTELSRIGKRGTIVMPSAIKDGLFNFEESTHLWLVLEHPGSGMPIFIFRNGQFRGLIDEDVQKISCHLYRTGPNRFDDQQILRNWYRKHEPELDVIHHWVDTCQVQVIQ